jgi:hypothetical protein
MGAGQRSPVGSFASPIGRLHFDERRIANESDYGLHPTCNDDRGSGAGRARLEHELLLQLAGDNTDSGS